MKKYVLNIGETDYSATVLEINDDLAKISIDGNIYEVNIKEFGMNGKMPAGEKISPVLRPGGSAAGGLKIPEKKESISGDGIMAPMPGVIISVKVKEGERIKAGEHVLTIEAMKMENEIKAPYDGIVGRVHVNENDNVSEEELLVELKRPAMTTL
ncbi:MAG: acetyl-CoA carboxylase biotin carboxyl carrier protein subunit [Candidatus Aminicenantes bacterium]|nr:acetyl-CoA carboxylase biotin carboxyl carrier protein subunit [Candidatus Aminicenantes bacterium]